MLVSEMKTRAEKKLGGVSLDESEVMDALNECLKLELSDVLRLEKNTETNVTEVANEVTPGSDVLKIILVKMNKAENNDVNGYLRELTLDDMVSTGYKLFDGKVQPQGITYPDTISVWYYRYPADITDLTDTPDMPSEFHQVLVYYLIGLYQQDDEQLGLEEDYLGKFYTMKAQIDSQRRKQVSVGRRRRVSKRAYV